MLNKQKGNMYGFITHTFNTCKGRCLHNCNYCYMKRFPQSELHFDEKELKTNLGEDNFIFVGSSCDMFANNIPNEWIKKTLNYCCKFPDNNYLFQSKNPIRFLEFITSFPPRTTWCTTVETNNRVMIEKYSGGMSVEKRVHWLSIIQKNKMVTVEPIMDFDVKDFTELLRKAQPLMIAIGADSGNNNLPEPSKEKVLELISELDKFTAVYQKDNLKRLLKGE